MNHSNFKKETAIMNCYLFPFRKDELSIILSFIERGRVPLSVVEALFFENKNIEGFYPLDFVKSFNELYEKIVERAASLSEAKSKEDVDMVMGSINFIFKTGTNVRKNFPNIVDYLRKDYPNLSEEDRNVKMELSDAIVVQENINDNFQKIINNQKQENPISAIFQNKKHKELSNINLFKAWEVVSQYIEGKAVTSSDVKLQKEIKIIFNEGRMNKVFLPEESETMKKLFSGLEIIEKTILNNSLERSLEVKVGLTIKKLKL